MSYDNPIYITYSLRAASVIADADLLDVAGPLGKLGRVVAIATVVTTGVTVAASTVVVGTDASNALYASLAIPISAADAVANSPTLSNTDANPIAANSRVVIGSGGGATAGAVNLDVTIAWY